MRMNAIYNIVFNRKNKVLGPGDTALLQVEIFTVHDRKKYIGTGIYIEAHQWDDAHQMIINHINGTRLTKRIKDFIADLQKFEISVIDTGRMMNVSDLNAYLNKTINKDQSFTEFMRATIEARNDIIVAVKNKHQFVRKEIDKRGINQFSDLTYSNIVAYDQWLRSLNFDQTTIHKRHAIIKTYMLRAIKSDLFASGANPYLKFPVPKGKAKIRTRLDDEEIEKLTALTLDDPELQFSRDLYVFEMYTGIAYKDVKAITYSANVNKNEGVWWIEALRKKNGEYFAVPLIPESVVIMNRYKKGDVVFPGAPDVWKQNRLLKIISHLAGIQKTITTHTARHTAATLMLRRGIPIDCVRDILGHASLKSTEIYAKLERITLREQMMKLTKKQTPVSLPGLPNEKENI